MKEGFEIDVKKAHLKVAGAAALVWVLLYVVFFIIDYLPLHGITAGGRPLYPWVESLLNASMCWSLVCLIASIVHSGIKNLRYIILEALLCPLFTLSALWLAYYPVSRPEAGHVALVSLMVFMFTVILTLILRGAKKLSQR